MIKTKNKPKSTFLLKYLKKQKKKKNNTEKYFFFKCFCNKICYKFFVQFCFFLLVQRAFNKILVFDLVCF